MPTSDRAPMSSGIVRAIPPSAVATLQNTIPPATQRVRCGPIADGAEERRGDEIDEEKRRRAEADGGVGRMQRRVLDALGHRREDEPVDVVEQVDRGEDREHGPRAALLALMRADRLSHLIPRNAHHNLV